MTILEYFEFTKKLSIDNDTQESLYHIDISAIKEEEEKIEKAIKGLLTFLINSGFKSETILSVVTAYIMDLNNHPDNDDFADNSAIEELVNDDKERDNFIQTVVKSEDVDFLKNVYRAWLTFHYAKKE